MSGLVYGSVCSGIEAATVAWHPLGWRPSFFSEIEAAPRAVLQHRHPEVPLHGDFTTIREGEYGAIDLLVGGTPCQSFSVAGLRGGLADGRGNLALEYLRLAQRLRPRWLVWENVPGVLSSNGGRDFGAILGGMVELGYGFAYRVLDAQYVRVRGFWRAVPQRRRRVFLVGYFGDWRRAAAVLLERSCLRGDPAPRREAGKRPAPTLSARPSGGGGLGTDFDCDGGLIAYGGNDTRGPISVATAVNAHGGPHGRLDFESETFIAFSCKDHGADATAEGATPTLRAMGFDRSHANAGGQLAVALGHNGGPSLSEWFEWAVRRLTPRECERLQGFADDYTLVPWRGGLLPDGPRYKALGNSMAVNVMRWIGQRIAEVDGLPTPTPGGLAEGGR